MSTYKTTTLSNSTDGITAANKTFFTSILDEIVVGVFEDAAHAQPVLKPVTSRGAWAFGPGSSTAPDTYFEREASGVLAARNAGDSAYGIIRGATPVGTNDLVTKDYVDTTFAAASHTHAAGDINSGTFDDSRIAASNVTQHVGAIDHNSLLNYGANKHVDHTGVSVVAGNGLSGGGTIAASRTFDINISGQTEDVAPGSTDWVMVENNAGGTFRKVQLTNLPGGGGGLNNIVEDISPQLGAMLDVNTYGFGDGVLELLSFIETGSAVNEFTIANAAAAGSPVLSATGDDTNIGMTLTPKGTGNITLGTMVFDSDQAIGAGQDNYVLTYDNGTGFISLEASAGGSSSLDGLTDVTISGTPADNELLAYNTGTGEFINQTAAEAGLSVAGHTHLFANLNDVSLSGVTIAEILAFDGVDWINNTLAEAGILGNVVEDTTPQLGGMLDINGQALGDGTLELLKFSETGSAVNEFTIANAATGNAPVLSATGDDAAVGITLTPKGTGNITLGTMVFDSDQTIGAGQDNYVLTYDNGTGLISLEVATGGGLTDIVNDTTPQIGGTVGLDMLGQDINNGGVIFLTAQAAAEADVAAKGQIWTKTGTTVTLMFTDNNGTDFPISQSVTVTLTGVTVGDVLTYDDGTGGFINQTKSAAGIIGSLVEDTTPQLGGMLDVNGQALGDGTLELLSFTETGSAVNEFTIANAATGNAPVLSATGDDANVGITLTPKGTGNITLGTMVFDSDQTIGVGQDNYVLTYDNGTGFISLEVAAAGGLADIVDDASPQLGAMLDVNGQSLGDGVLELLKFVETGSAINEFTITNAATGNAPVLSATGDDAVIGITLTPKGAGNITLGTMVFDSDQAIGAGQDNYILTYDNGTGFISLEAASGGGANTALSNLSAVAVSESLTSDTDITDDLGTEALRWKDIYAATIGTGQTAADTFKIRGYDTDAPGFVDILTVTANTTVTADLNAITTIGGNAIVDSTVTALASLVTVQGLTITLADAGADAILGWDDTTGAYENLTQAEVLAVIGSAAEGAQGVVELATVAEIDTGTDATRAIAVDQFQASFRNLRFPTFGLVEAGTVVAAATDIHFWTAPFAGVIVQDDANPYWFQASLRTGGTTGTMVVDIQKNGTTIMTTNKLNIETGEVSSGTATTQPDLTTTTFVAGDVFTFEIVSVHTTPGSGLEVTMAVRPT